MRVTHLFEARCAQPSLLGGSFHKEPVPWLLLPYCAQAELLEEAPTVAAMCQRCMSRGLEVPAVE